MDALLKPERVTIGVKSLLSRPFVLLAIQVVAFWSVWQWALGRFATSGESAWEILPLASIIFLFWLAEGETKHTVSPTALFLSAFLTLGYAGSILLAPPLVRAVLAVAAIAPIVGSWRFGKVFHPGIFILFLLSLPVVDSLNFFLGYPMRVLVGEAVELLLKLQGLDVYREGVGLHFNETLIWIDAPCSGIKMLWFGTFLTTSLSTYLRLDWLKLAVVGLLSLAAVIAGNILRASALFYIESGLIEVPHWMHSAVGMAAFALTSVAIVLLVVKTAGVKWQR